MSENSALDMTMLTALQSHILTIESELAALRDEVKDLRAQLHEAGMK